MKLKWYIPVTLVLLSMADRGPLPAHAFPQDPASTAGEESAPGLPQDYSCTVCHGPEGMLAGIEENRHLIVSEHDLLADIHWQKGLRCHDCHGGSASMDDFVAHRNDESFRRMASPADIPAFCGHCHSSIEYMRKYQPSPRTDQESEYWTSGHGQHLKSSGDAGVATCVSCHGGHGIVEVASPQSPVYPTQVAETCATCHANAELMAGREYHGKPLGHEQYELWSHSVHANALLKNGDLSAATCNDCHGNHGAVPPEASSVANACGTCHVKVAELFANTQMKHRFEQLDLPGCVTCHGNHAIHQPSDEMLGMGPDTFCARCHKDGKFGATLAGADAARTIKQGLDELRTQIARSEETVAEAERLGMEVRGPKFDLREAETALTKARTEIHSFAPAAVNQSLEKGLQVAADVQTRAEQALGQYTYRRIWLAVSTLPILLVVVLLLMYIRALPIPGAGTRFDRIG